MGSSLVPLKSALLMTRRKKGSWNIGGIKVQRGERASTDRHEGTKEQPKWWGMGWGFG